MRRYAPTALLVAIAIGTLAGPARAFVVRSRSFAPGGKIPAPFAMKAVPGGADRSPELHWTAPPRPTRSLVIRIVDRNPIAHDWVHWLVIDLPARVREIPAGASGHLPSGSRELRNSFGTIGYGGPLPPPGSGVHPYEVDVYAVSVPRLDVGPGATWAQVRVAMDAHVLAHASVVGMFER